MTNEEFDALRKQERDFVSENYDDVKNEIAEALQQCAGAYKKLVDERVNYAVEYFDSKDKLIQNFTFSFSTAEFEHLTGLGKLDLKNSSDKLYKRTNGIYKSGKLNSAQSVAEDIVKDRYFFDDTIIEIPDATAPVEEKEKYEDTMKELKAREFYLKTDMLSRFSTLEHFYQTMENVQLDDSSNVQLRLYNWLRNTVKEDARTHRTKIEDMRKYRPRSSKIDADFLLECYDSSKEKPYVDFFVIEEKSHKFSDVSIFPSETTYSDDTPEHKAAHKDNLSRKLSDNLTVLSVTKSMEQDGKVITETKKADSKVIDKSKQLAEQQRIKLEKEENAPHAKEIKKAVSIVRNLKSNRDNTKRQKVKEYEKQLNRLQEETDYTLKEVKGILENSLNVGKNKESTTQIKKELKLIGDILNIRELVGNLSEIKENSTEENVFEQIDKYNDVMERIIKLSEGNPVLRQAVLQAIEQQNMTHINKEVESMFLENEHEHKFLSKLKSGTGESTIFAATFSNPEQHSMEINPYTGAGAIALQNTGNNPFSQLIEKIREGVQKLKDFVVEKVEQIKEKMKENTEKKLNRILSEQEPEDCSEEIEIETPEEQIQETQLPELAVRVDNIINISATELHCHSMEQYRFEGECTQSEYADKLNGIIFLNEKPEKPVQEQKEEIQESQKRNNYDYDR